MDHPPPAPEVLLALPFEQPRFPWARLFEFFSLASFAGLELLGWREVLASGPRPPESWMLVLGLCAGWLLSDAASGVLHFLADTYWHEDSPFIGRAFIAPFRQHHRDPLTILEHGFLERNGNNASLALVAFCWVPWVKSGDSPGLTLLNITCLSWGLWCVATNEIHAWAHARTVPMPIRWAQRAGLLLSPEQHKRHHSPPHTSHYCITSGIWDRLGALARRF